MTLIIRLLAAAGLACTWAAAAHADDIAIAGIVFQQDQYFRGIQLGMEAGAKDTGVTCCRPIPNPSSKRKPS